VGPTRVLLYLGSFEEVGDEEGMLACSRAKELIVGPTIRTLLRVGKF